MYSHENNLSMRKTIGWIVWITASIFYSYQYILRVMPSIMMNDILYQFNIDTTTFGQFSGIYYIGYALMHLPLGILLDRFGVKKIMPMCILLTVLGLLPILFSENWFYSIVGRALIGMGSSAAILGIFKIIRLIFNEKRFTRMLSFSVTIGLMGAIYGGGPVNYMCTVLGYKMVTAIFASIGVGLCMVMYCIVPDLKTQPTATVISQIKTVFCSAKVIWLCFFAGLMVGPLEGFADVWGSEFLKQVYGLEGIIAASLPSAIFVGMCFGAPVLSFIAEKTKNDFATIIGAGIAMTACFFVLLSTKIPIMYLSGMFIIVGICCAYQIIAIYKASTYVNEEAVGLTTATANMIIMIFGYAFHSVIGWIINHMGGPENAKAFVYGIAVIPIALSIGVMGLIIIALQERNVRNKTTVFSLKPKGTNP